MTYDPQQQRPEEQTNNSNRETLNIQQPGENANTGFDWGAVRAAREAAGRQSKAPQSNDPSIGLKDVGLAIASAPFELVHSGAQLFNAGVQKLGSKAEEYRNGEREPAINIPVSPEMLNVMRENSGNPLSATSTAFIKSAGSLTGEVSKEIQSSYSEGARDAAALKFVEKDKQGNWKAGSGLFDKDTWMMNAVPSIAQMLTGGWIAKMGAQGAERAVEQAVFNRLSKTLPEEAARMTARETASQARQVAQKTGYVGIMAGSAQGASGNELRDEINAIPFEQLIASPTFQKAFSQVDSDPAHKELSDTQKLTLARSQVAEQAAGSITADPRMLAINIAASTLGDHTILNLLTKKGAAKSVMSGFATGTVAEGGTELVQGTSQRYLQNRQLIDTAGQKIDPMKDVLETGVNNMVLGGAIGGAAGTVGGIRGHRSAAEATSENPVNADGLPVSENIDPSKQQEVTPQAENQASPEVAVQRSSVSENGVPNSQIDDFRDTPAYLRQDPRVQGFADDSDVQRSLAEPEAQPTAQDLIQQQMESGEQGFTPDELAILEQADQIRAQRTPRLPAPGNIHPGEGFPMPGPIQGDESQAGAAPQFTAGEQTRGQVYLPREQAEQQGAVRETHTYDGQTDPQAITDKNIIFAEGPATNPDEVQSGQAPQFDGGQRKDVRRFTEAMGGQPETAITDQRQRAGGVPIDARTETYAKGETLGELRLHHGKPFPNEKVARFTKWAKMPGAVIEPVGDGFGVRLPPEPTTANTKTAPSNEGVVASGEQPVGELRLHLGKPFNSEKVAKYSKWGKMPGATIEPVGKGYGVRLPVPEPVGQAKNSDAKIDDFGEELKGAAKHKWGQLAESLKADHDIEEIKKQPLSKLFPHPDYSKMHENGIEPEKLALLAALRSFIPNKPGSPYKLNQWAEQVKGVRDLASSIINSHASVDDIKTIFRSKSSLRSAADAIDLISQFKPEQMAEASKYSIRSGHYTYFDGKSYPGGKTLYELVTPGGMKTDISAGSMQELLPKAKAFIETKINSDKGDDALKQAQLTPRQAKLEIYTMIDLERSNSTFMKAARQAKKVLTVSTTSMPDFIIRNFMRDSIHSWAINKDGFKPVTASWAGFKKALRTDDSLVDMMFAGATFGGGYSNVYDPASTAKTIRSVLRRKGYNDSQIHEFESSIARNSKEVMGKIEQGLHKYKNLSEAAENANRLATYEAAIKSGKSKAQAAFESRDLMDFSMMGASKIMINLSDMLPFFNARMQGLSKLGRGIKEDPREVLKRGGMITAASLALMALNWDDKRYEELQDWDKDTYWHAWIGGQHIRFPKPFEFGAIFGTLPERFVRALGGKDTGAKFGKLVAHNFMETMAFNPIPQVAMPIAEAYVNYDFFKGGPIENMADSNLMAGARYNDQTSLLMREVGEATNMSPKMLDHIVMGYTGSLGGYVMGATNLLMRNLKDYGETPAMRLDEMPVIKSFFRGSDPAKSTQFTEDFYRMMTEANQINSTINSFRKQGRGDDASELIEENRGKLSQRQGLTATQKQVKALNAQIEMMRRDRILTADQKREKIDRLMATRNKLVQQAVERVNGYFG
ncbi:TPA: LPD38 domain-containing protein [Yersinia enterocolitica]